VTGSLTVLLICFISVDVFVHFFYAEEHFHRITATLCLVSGVGN